MDVITAVNAVVRKTPIENLQQASDPRGVRLSLRSLTEMDCANPTNDHDGILEDAGRRGLARDLVLRLVEYACNASHEAPQDRNSIYFVRAPIAIIVDDQFQADLERTVDDKSMDRARICLEIPETHMLERFSSVSNLWRLKDRSFLMSLANFGTGVSSVAWLKYFPVAFVQIAPSFVSEILSDPVSREMVREFNEIAHLTGRRSIAAGVESVECLMLLRNLGVDYVEGPAIGS
jgi:EAL domain-containing protein (putative c-di-GMP-specific phosphodiesterase class I)